MDEDEELDTTFRQSSPEAPDLTPRHYQGPMG
jgi:hypothetical protein